METTLAIVMALAETAIGIAIVVYAVTAVGRWAARLCGTGEEIE